VPRLIDYLLGLAAWALILLLAALLYAPARLLLREV